MGTSRKTTKSARYRCTPILALLLCAATVARAQPRPVPAVPLTADQYRIRREIVQWFNGVEIPRKTEVEQIAKDSQSLDQKATDGSMQPTDILQCYQLKILPRFQHIMDMATRFPAQTSEVSELSRYLIYYTRLRIEALNKCIADLQRGDLKTFHKDQLHYLFIDDSPFDALKATTSKQYMR